MKIKTCNTCKATNGGRASYCRKCGNAIISEAVDAPKAHNIRSKSPVAEPIPSSVNIKKPTKPVVNYLPLVLSITSAMLIVPLVLVFNLYQNGVIGKAKPHPIPALTTPRTTTASTVVDEPDESRFYEYDFSNQSIPELGTFTYTGNPITLSLTLQNGDEELIEGVDYYVSYENNVTIGEATMIISGNGETTTGVATTHFNIETGDRITDNECNFDIVEFINRVYVNFLGRYPEYNTLVNTTNALNSHSITGAAFINSVINSDEFQNRNISDEFFVDAVYNGILNRAPDTDGRTNNLAALGNGTSRRDLINGIINASEGEFVNICISCEITPN
ncbi:MAG: DUF4214 domain-containing protein [Saccharofermentans sp.]|nr:DUF4214 domain-containing protein [Saccharofermentans sp.]